MKDWPSLTLRFPPGRAGTLADMVSAAFDPETLAAIEERSETQWLVSFRDAAARDAALADLRAQWSSQDIVADPVDVSDEDWARRSQANLGAVRVGRLLVVPPWLATAEPDHPGTVRLVIEPSMGFGSGHHATTRLCLAALQAVPVVGARVLDIGTGSGILAIAAVLLGASSVLGLDNDPDALESARADAAMNGVTTALTFEEADVRAGSIEPADVVLANLTGSMLAAHADAVMRCAAPGGLFILSGITTAEADAVIEAWTPACRIVSRNDDDGWVGLVLEAGPYVAPDLSYVAPDLSYVAPDLSYVALDL
jgi:ribosomal protein L11 methyltransferase